MQILFPLSMALLAVLACKEQTESAGVTEKKAVDEQTKESTDPSDKTRDDRDDDDRSASGGTLAINMEVADHLSGTGANLQEVGENIGPPTIGALAIDQGGGGALALIALADEAAEVKLRIKGTLEGTARVLSWVRDIIHRIEPQLRNHADKKSGRIDMGFEVLDYQFTTKTSYKVHLVGGEGGDYSLAVDGNHYILKRQPSSQINDHPGINFVDVTFVDENNWIVKDDNTSDVCATRPKVISSHVERVAGIWQGKIMYWSGPGGANCLADPTPDNTSFTYYQFVGNAAATTAAGYSNLPITLVDFEELDTYSFRDEVNTIANPVCILENVAPTPATACVSEVEAIGTPDYGIPDKWILPEDLSKIWNVFPASIEN